MTISIACPATVHSGRVWDVFSTSRLLASVLHAASSIERCAQKDAHW